MTVASGLASAGGVVRWLVVGGCLLLCGGAAAPEASWWSVGAPLGLAAPKLRLGVDASYPPLAAVAPDGGLYGLEVELAGELATRLGVPLELSNTDVGGGLDALAAGRFDGLLAGLSRSPDLLERAVFSRPYFDDGPRLVRWSAGSALGPERLSVELGSAADRAARAQLRTGQRFELLREESFEAVLVSLRDRSADAALLDLATARRLVDSQPGLVMAPEVFEPRPLALALRRSNRGLEFAVDRALAEMAADGTLTRLARRWMGA